MPDSYRDSVLAAADEQGNMSYADAILVDREDAEALARFIYEHLQYDDDTNAQFWQSILDRLLYSLNH